MRSSAVVVLALALCVYSCLAQIPGLGSCPSVTTKPDFDPVKYLGKWYEIQRYFAVFEIGGTCASATYSAGPNGTINVFNKGLNSWTGKEDNVTGVATPDLETPSKLNVVFSGQPITTKAPYWVLDTDYTNYAVVWSCSKKSFFNFKLAWILARDRNPSSEVLQTAYDVLKKNGVSQRHLMKTKQTDCPEGY